jgi:amidase
LPTAPPGRSSWRTGPLLLTPALAQLPIQHGADTATPQGTAALQEAVRQAITVKLLGLPSACVPTATDHETGLPIGVLVSGPRLREHLCLDAAEAIEARLGLATPIDPKG